MTARTPHFVGPWTDSLFIGLFSVGSFFVFWGLEGKLDYATWMPIVTFLLWVINWPHFSASSYRLYGSRESIRQYPVTSYFAPVIVAAAVAACLVFPVEIGPHFVKFFRNWSAYHFSAQTLGITLLFARRAGMSFAKTERLALAGFIFGCFLTGATRAEVATRTLRFAKVEYPSFEFHPAVPWVFMTMLLVCAVYLLVRVVKPMLEKPGAKPWIVLVPAVTHFFWYVPGYDVPVFRELVPAFHSLQYFFIAWFMNLREAIPATEQTVSKERVIATSLKWWGWNIAGGVGLFVLLPKVTGLVGGPAFLVESFVLAGVQVHHFFVDGVIWKLRNAKVASPLMSDLDQILHPSPAPEARRAA